MVRKPLRNISKIEVGFRGLIQNNFRHLYVTYTFTMSGAVTKVKNHTQNHVFFNEVVTFDYDKPIDLIAGESPPVEKQFNFCFPTDQHLPSSCEKLGGVADNEGNSTVSYYVFVRVKNQGDLLHPEDTNEYKFPLKFQGSSESYAPDILKRIQVSHTFEAKLKKRIYDAELERMIPNPIVKPRKLSRNIRKLWNDNYKIEKYQNLAKDVTLNCQFVFNKNFNLNQSLDDLIKLRFSIKDLGTEFQVGGESTGLGEFIVKQLELQLIHDLKIRTDYFIYKTRVKDDLYLVKPKQGVLMDVKDFQFDSIANVWYRDMTISELTGNTSNIPLIDELIRPVMCSYDLDSLFYGYTSLNFILDVGNAETENSETIKFETEASGVVTYFQSLPAYDEEYASPPPAFSP
ncbi:hypothetical protein FOA43_003997 [Brettanomyces nanus]|uniref:Uncharacterized protein n=1 Tax=Eeniella nana TaxID=13502 RepID=A0A875S8U5_EENNA|nr:uncharacterized protein FOA43_003997 [Brettanomyces nanus]QPG76605.1 hypothetical protein FOA43_003997 [Brettanomyces nanus]